jgi:uncharacterized protein YkwD
MHISTQIGCWGVLPISTVLEAWKNSPGHNASMLRPEWLSMAVCVVVTVYPDGTSDVVAITNFTW